MEVSGTQLNHALLLPPLHQALLLLLLRRRRLQVAFMRLVRERG